LFVNLWSSARRIYLRPAKIYGYGSKKIKHPLRLNGAHYGSMAQNQRITISIQEYATI
jgi:hypothetical protein